MWHIVRESMGKRSGPMTISATTPMTTISEKPMSNMRHPAPDESGSTLEVRSSSRLFLLRFAFDRLADDLLRRLGALRRSLALRTLHAVLEAFHRAAQVLADVAQLLGPEDQHDDEQHDQPVPDAQSTHIVLLYYMPGLGSILPSGSGPPMICTCRCMTSWRPMRPLLMIVP